MMRILFQGDSVTDAGRNRENTALGGRGYATMVSAKLGFEYPGEYEFMNRGISGNRVVDLLARMKADIINLQPDVMSILIGVNDVWHEFNFQNGTGTELYEQFYNILIGEVKAALPDIRMIIMEPFILKGTETTKYWPAIGEEVRKKAAAARRVAEKNQLEFIPLQDKFDAALKLAPEEYWLRDGVHPSAAGHELIAREWIRTFLGEK